MDHKSWGDNKKSAWLCTYCEYAGHKRDESITLDHKIHVSQGTLGTKGLSIYNFHKILTEPIASTVAENMARYSASALGLG